MKRFRSLLLAVAGLPLLVHAQVAGTTPTVTDANVNVPPPPYQSAFDHYLPLAEPEGSPDKGWIQANRDVAGLAGHGAHGGAPMAAPAASKPADAARPPPPDERHRGHQMNMKGH